MRNILTPFLAGTLLLYLPKSERGPAAKDVFHTFVVGVYFSLLGGWLADRFFDKYRTILWSASSTARATPAWPSSITTGRASTPACFSSGWDPAGSIRWSHRSAATSSTGTAVMEPLGPAKPCAETLVYFTYTPTRPASST
jgi:hypothetical protein